METLKDIKVKLATGKMPVYKNLTKTSKTEEPKKEEKKKKEDEATKKRRVEMDAEIQKKVETYIILGNTFSSKILY